MRCEGAKDDPAWIADRLIPRITPLKAKKSLRLLMELKFVTFDQTRQRLFPTEENISTDVEVVGLTVLAYHQQMIDLAKESLLKIPPAFRDISVVTVAISKQQMETIKQEVHALQEKIMAMGAGQKQNSIVAQVNIQVFPLAIAEEGDVDVQKVHPVAI